MIFKLIVLIIVAYFLGNINFARLLSKVVKDDITKHGSGNPGTMNMLRNFGFIFATCTLILDALKGAIPAFIGYKLMLPYGQDWAVYAMQMAGFSAVIGHIFPVIYKFKGGKGVATAFGYFTVVNPLISLTLFLVGLILFFVIKIGSVSSMVYINVFVLYHFIINFNKENVFALIIMVLTAAIIVYAHRSNFKNLFKKQESKIKISEVVEKDKKIINTTKEKLKNGKNKN